MSQVLVSSVFHQDIDVSQLIISHVHTETRRWHSHLEALRKHSVMLVARVTEEVYWAYQVNMQIPSEGSR